MKYPDQYLHVEDKHSGQTWIMPIGDEEPLDIVELVGKWVHSEYGGELFFDRVIGRSFEGDYFARIMTDGREPDSAVCWTSGGFWLR